jgi:hypothetical protein
MVMQHPPFALIYIAFDGSQLFALAESSALTCRTADMRVAGGAPLGTIFSSTMLTMLSVVFFLL